MAASLKMKKIKMRMNKAIENIRNNEYTQEIANRGVVKSALLRFS